MKQVKTSFGLNLKPYEFVIFLGVLILGLFLRFTDLTDPPLDFHPMRQLRGAILARGYYFQLLAHPDPELARRVFETMAMIEPQEPPVLEKLVALTYWLTGGERLWIARVYSILFWLVAGFVFFALARRLSSSRGALAFWAYFWLLPFSVVVSRVFQPEPFLVMWVAITLFLAYQWGQNHSWKWTLATGVLAGWTMFVKITAVYYLAPALLALILTQWGIKKAVRDGGVWLVAVFSLGIPSIYYLGTIGESSTGWFSGWGLSFTELLLTPRFYIAWLKYVDYLFDLTLVAIALAGVVWFPEVKDRWFLLSLWIGYILFGLTFPYPIQTHEYYSIMMIPIIGLSLSSIAAAVMDGLRRQSRLWYGLLIGVSLFFVAYSSWLTYTGLIGVNFANEPKAWQKMGEALPEGKVIGLTHDYGYRIAYYGARLVYLWPTSADFEMLAQRNQGYQYDFPTLFAERAAGMDYFLVTLMGELESQPMLKEHLYKNYPIAAEGDGYILFDLQHPLKAQP